MRRRRNHYLATALGACLLACAPGAAAGAQAGSYVPGKVLIGFARGVPARVQRSLERSVGATSARALGPVDANTRLPPAVVVRVPDSRTLAAVDSLRRSHAVIYAEPDRLFTASAVPNNPDFAKQWALQNTGQSLPTQNQNEKEGPEAPGSAGADINATGAWNLTTGSRSIVIAEVDTGIDYDHPDLAANIWTNPGGIGGCAAGTHGFNVSEEEKLFGRLACSPDDNDAVYGGHGTHVAGIMGAVGNDGLGVAGINWQTTILPVKWLNSKIQGTTEELADAIGRVLEAKRAGVNVRVVNDSAVQSGDTVAAEAVQQKIEELGQAGILFVTAAGNGNGSGEPENVDVSPRYPCDYRLANEICATATNNLDQLPAWANFGPSSVDLAAPGVSIYSTLREESAGEEHYGYLTGGSMAAAAVSGSAALIASAAPCLSDTELKSDILEHVDALPQLAGKVRTGGRLDLFKAIRGCPGPPAPEPPPGPPPPPPTPPPAIGALAISPASFHSRARRRHEHTGAVIAYMDSEAATTTFSVYELLPGVRASVGRCLAPRAHSRPKKASRCTRHVLAATFTHVDVAGANRVRLTGRVRGRPLPAGSYLLSALPALGPVAGTPAHILFRIL